MRTIIPAINAKSFSEVEERIRRVEPYCEWAHIDVADGRFTSNVLWRNPAELKNLITPLKLEVHLMVEHPEEEIEEWIGSGAQRLIIHIESTTKEAIDGIIEKCMKSGIEVAIALNPETPPEVADPYIGRIRFVQCLAVHPGKSGQEFQEHTYEKIKTLRSRYPNLDIEVDGGVKVGVAKRAKEAGATIFAAASAIFNAGNIKEAIEDLESDVGE